MEEDQILPPGPQKTLEWITVLCAAGLDYRLSMEDNAWVLYIPAENADRAREEIRLYEQQNRNWLAGCRPAPEPDKAESFHMNIWFAYVLLVFHLRLGAFDATNPLLRAACADGPAIMAGEWWRTVTALTIHSGIVHLLSNMVFIILVGHFVCRAFGGGLGILLILISGALANWLTAAVIQPEYLSVGASTAGFAALGILVTRQVIKNYRRYPDWRSIWSRVWLPFCAGLAMLGMTGTGPRSDIAAHAFGFITGMLAAFPLALLEKTPPRRTQIMLVTLAATILATAWISATGY